MIESDEELAIWRKQLALVESIVESWKRELLPHNPKNFAIYAEGAIEEAEKLRAEIDAYLKQKNAKPVATDPSQPATGQQPTSAA
jgi:hypothetical protein